jgi:DNA-binding MarR family transcriptional regulator
MVRSTYKSNLSTNEKVLMGIVRTAEIFKRAHAGVFKKYGLSFPQYNVLRVLEASANGRNMIGEVGRIMLVPGANMTGIAKRMERQGFIRRTSDPGDERVTMLEITPKGRRILTQIQSEKDEWLERLLDGFSQEERHQLLSAVQRLIRKNVRFAGVGATPSARGV